VKEAKTTTIDRSVTSSEVSSGAPALTAVLNGGYCIGRGACAAVAFGVKIVRSGYFRSARLDSNTRLVGRSRPYGSMTWRQCSARSCSWGNGA
jgi:hypothetical protein